MIRKLSLVFLSAGSLTRSVVPFAIALTSRRLFPSSRACSFSMGLPNLPRDRRRCIRQATGKHSPRHSCDDCKLHGHSSRSSTTMQNSRFHSSPSDCVGDSASPGLFVENCATHNRTAASLSGKFPFLASNGSIHAWKYGLSGSHMTRKIGSRDHQPVLAIAGQQARNALGRQYWRAEIDRARHANCAGTPNGDGDHPALRSPGRSLRRSAAGAWYTALRRGLPSAEDRCPNWS